jgi:hypothetical protein
MKIIGDKNAAINYEMDAYRMSKTFPRLRHDLDAIGEIREMYRRLELDALQRKRSSGGLGRRVAHLPAPVFVWMTTRFPEVLRNKNLLRSFLRANPQYCIVEKL